MSTVGIEYTADDTTLEGQIARPSGEGPFPGVLVCHTWAGQGDFEAGKAEALAELGYVALACDVYGKGVRGGTIEDNQRLLNGMMGDRALLLERLEAGLECLASQADVDPDRIAAIGFCFGGLCVLDIARGGSNVAGVVSFHGLLGAPELTADGDIQAPVLALHGWDDPMATPEQVVAFAAEMSARNADWQLQAYGNTVHAFTNPAANDVEKGTVYDPTADRRSWQAMQNFLSEVFS